MPKERSINPAQAQRKAEKQKEIAKNKKQIQHQRNEKLGRRNPERLQRQIDELKELEGRGALRPKDKEVLAQLERDVKAITRARDALGDAAPKFPSHERRGRRERGDAGQEQRDRRQNLGKRRRDEEDAHSSETDPDVRDIPMPRDASPPIPRAERARLVDPQVGPDGQRVPHALPAKPAAPAPPQLVYSSAPQLRDLKKEATKFVPSIVAQKKKLVKGKGRLLEPEEIEQLEKSGYYAAQKAAQPAGQDGVQDHSATAAKTISLHLDLDEELRRYELELTQTQPRTEQKPAERQVQPPEVEDDGD